MFVVRVYALRIFNRIPNEKEEDFINSTTTSKLVISTGQTRIYTRTYGSVGTPKRINSSQIRQYTIITIIIFRVIVE